MLLSHSHRGGSIRAGRIRCKRLGFGWIAAGFLAVVAAGLANAGTKVRGSIIAVADGSNLYNFAKPGKYAFKSKDAQSGGMSIQLNLKGVDCPTGDPDKCDSSDNVMELTVAFNGGALETHTGILFDVAGGKAASSRRPARTR